MLIKNIRMVLTDEQRKERYNAYQREYQRRKYNSNLEYAEKRKKQVLEKYGSITTEQKEKRNEYAKLYYQKKKELAKISRDPEI